MQNLMSSYVSENLFVEKIEGPSYCRMPNSHHHKNYELYYLAKASGSVYYNIGNEKFHIEEGSVVIIDSNVPHQTDYSQSTYYKRFLLEISPDFLKKELGTVIRTPINLFFQKYTGVHFLDKQTSSNIENVLTTIYNESILKEKYYEDIVLLRILEIILLMDRNFEQLDSENTNQLKTMRPVVQHIMENLETDLSLESLAHSFYLDKSYLSRAFKQYTGHTVHDFINLKRMERAQRLLLLYLDEPIYDIAVQLGFNNAAYFSKIFKKYVGTTPTKFRKENAY